MSDEEAALRAELAAVKAELAAIEAVPEPLSHDEQVALLERGIAELRKQGWKEWTARPTPYETSLRKGSIFTRQFMAFWVEDDGRLIQSYVGGVTPRIVPFVFFDV